MKQCVTFTLFLLVIVSTSVAQTSQEYIVTATDIQICFPYTDPNGGGTIRQWYSPESPVISYNTDAPVGVHKEKTKLGVQRFEGLLQADEPILGKVVMEITISSLPAPDRRVMEIRFRVRAADGSIVSMWSDIQTVKFIGKPGKLSRVEVAPAQI